MKINSLIPLVHLFKKKSLYFFFVCICSLCTYLPYYHSPSALFWDENYHIASAQKYLHGIFFMEPHPPLGKLLIAAGEYFTGANSSSDQFIGVEKASELPKNFSFTGYRLFPVVGSAMIAPLLFLLLQLTTKSTPISITVSLAAAFDNALIVHGRGAMLEGMQLSCILCCLYAFFKNYRDGISKKWLFVLAISSSAALLIKANSICVLILPLYLLLTQKKLRFLICFYLFPFCLFFALVWHTHFLLGKKVHTSLDHDGYFGASKEYIEALNRHETWNPKYFFVMLKDSLTFSSHYQKGVPTLNYCKPDENGSYPLLWPLGAKNILYRWDQSGIYTRYLYLTPNPISWFFGALGVALACIIVGGKFLGFNSLHTTTSPIAMVLSLYFLSWGLPFFLPRVFYLYHYFIPLLFSWVLLGLSLPHIKKLGNREISETQTCLMALLASSVLILSYVFFMPLTYALPITQEQLQRRSILSLWDLHHQGEMSNNPFARPITEKQESSHTSSSKSWELSIGNLSANYIEQSTGIPLQEETGFEVRPKSKIQFPLNEKYSQFEGNVSLHEKHLDGQLQFRIIGDGVDLWRSQMLTSQHPHESFNISVNNIKVLVLLVTTPIDDKEKDLFGVWRKLSLVKN